MHSGTLHLAPGTDGYRSPVKLAGAHVDFVAVFGLDGAGGALNLGVIYRHQAGGIVRELAPHPVAGRSASADDTLSDPRGGVEVVVRPCIFRAAPEAVTLTLVIFGKDVLFSMPRALAPPEAVAITSVIVGGTRVDYDSVTYRRPDRTGGPAAMRHIETAITKAHTAKRRMPAIPKPVKATSTAPLNMKAAPETAAIHPIQRG